MEVYISAVKKTLPELKDWVEIKIVLTPEDFKFLKQQAQDKAVSVTDWTRQILLSHIGRERGGL